MKNTGGFWKDNLTDAAISHRGKTTFNLKNLNTFSSNPIAYILEKNGTVIKSHVPNDVRFSTATEALDTTLYLVHEMIHMYWNPITIPTNMSHWTMDDAAAAALKKLYIKSSVKRKARPSRGEYFDDVLREVCQGVKL